MEIVVGSWHQERISLADRFLRSRVQITSIAYKIDPSRECILYENRCERICACHECEADA
jgi:hypothetical protein